MAREKKQVNNAFYDDLDGKWGGVSDHPIALLKAENHIRTPWVCDKIKENKPQPCRVLDVGCGGGLLSVPLALQGHLVTGIDLSEKSLIWAKSQDSTQSIEFLKADAQSLPFPDSFFDVVCAMDLLEHVPCPEKVIKESARVLKPGGLFFFHTFNKTFLSYLLVIKALEWFVKNTPKDMHLYSHFIKPATLEHWCKDQELSIESMHGLVPDLFHTSFWQTAFTREIHPSFRFVFSKSLMTGYVGYASKLLK
ncbi:MAG: 3-demethylubiquinone-9 3-O-methyltransferase [Chlamydiae bacterium]|nr:3-demethylubiquinone-9 3-O-methyltransferase [Chlamydiota bacterium]